MARQNGLKRSSASGRKGGAGQTLGASRVRQTSSGGSRPAARPAGNGKAGLKPKTADPKAVRAKPAGQPVRAVDPAAAPPPRKPGYYEALAMYESGVRALQRHDYEGAAGQFRSIIERYPEERELQERSQLYLRVCERETARRPATPQTPQERVYAATVALNAGDTAGALDHLRRALADAPDSDHAHYIMSVAQAAAGDPGRAMDHLRQAVSLNPENRTLARQDPDLEAIRDLDGFRELVEGPAGAARGKARKKR